MKFYIITDAKVVMGSLVNISIRSSVKKKMISNARVIEEYNIKTVIEPQGLSVSFKFYYNFAYCIFV